MPFFRHSCGKNLGKYSQKRYLFACRIAFIVSFYRIIIVPMLEFSRTIVCVDDEEIVLESLEMELSEALSGECVLEFAQSGNDALTLLNDLHNAGTPVAVILCGRYQCYQWCAPVSVFIETLGQKRPGNDPP
jgi:hypothetical protein